MGRETQGHREIERQHRDTDIDLGIARERAARVDVAVAPVLMLPSCVSMPGYSRFAVSPSIPPPLRERKKKKKTFFYSICLCLCSGSS